jgi:hypothetical protein
MCRRGGLYPCETTPFSPHLTPPRLRTGESMQLVYFWPSPTSMARRESQRRASAVQWWVGTVRFYVQKRAGLYPCETTPFILATLFDTTPSPHGRINAASLLLAFAHIPPWRGGKANFGHLKRGGGSERSVSMCRRGGFYISAKRLHSRHI